MGGLYKNNRLSAAFDVILYGVGGPDLAGVKNFSMYVGRQHAVCGWSGCGLRRLCEKQRAAAHWSSFAVSEKKPHGVNPITDRPGPIQVAQSFVFPRKVLFGIILSVWSFLVRVKQSLSGSSLSESFSSTLPYMRKTFSIGIVNGATSVENGAIGGVTTSQRDGHPWWASWFARRLGYTY